MLRLATTTIGLIEILPTSLLTLGCQEGFVSLTVLITNVSLR